MKEKQLKVVIGIPTYRRPKGLQRLLGSIAELKCADECIIVVADNDAESMGGIDAARDLSAKGFPFQIISFPVPARGLSPVRNALLRKGFDDLGADLVAMVDDDERVESEWLVELLAMQKATHADVVFGAIFAEFESRPPDWIKGQAIYWGNKYAAGPAKVVPGSGSVLISRRVHDDLQARFDDRFAMMGGEDCEFFSRIGSNGATFAHAPRAVSHEFVGASRMTRRWALQRAFRVGCTDMHVLKLHGLSLWRWSRIVLLSLAASVVALLTGVLGGLSTRLQMKSALLLARQLGKVAAFLGRTPAFYAVTHGD